jgi:hypothetical protein
VTALKRARDLAAPRSSARWNYAVAAIFVISAMCRYLVVLFAFITREEDGSWLRDGSTSDSKGRAGSTTRVVPPNLGVNLKYVFAKLSRTRMISIDIPPVKQVPF